MGEILLFTVIALIFMLIGAAVGYFMASKCQPDEKRKRVDECNTIHNPDDRSLAISHWERKERKKRAEQEFESICKSMMKLSFVFKRCELIEKFAADNDLKPLPKGGYKMYAVDESQVAAHVAKIEHEWENIGGEYATTTDGTEYLIRKGSLNWELTDRIGGTCNIIFYFK